MNRHVLMVGDAIDGPGGISSVARTYRDSGILAALDVTYLSNYDGAGLWSQARVMTKLLMRVLQAARTGGVALLHVHTASRGGFWRAFLLCELARRRRIPYVLHVHSGEFITFYEKECGDLRKGAVRRAMRDAARVVCLTEGWCRSMAAIEPKAHFAALPNPVPLPADLTAESDNSNVMLLYLGRLTEKKGIFDLLAALDLLRSRGIKAKLTIGGVGEEEAMLTKIRLLGLADLIDYRGWVDDTEKDTLLRQATMLVAPSHFEAFGVSIVEAMVYGKPVVATRVGGIPEVLDDAVDGLLVPANDPESLANAIARLIADPNLQRTMGESGRQHALAKFTTGRVRTDLSLIYRDIVAAPPV